MKKRLKSKADNILREVLRRKLTSYNAAQLSCIPYPLFCRLLTQDRIVSLKTAARLCDTFGESAVEMLEVR